MLFRLCFLILGALASSQANAQESYDQIEFSSDERERSIALPKDKTCTFLLDDDSNYAFTKVDSSTVIVRTLAINERSALFVIDCLSEVRAYRLSFVNQERYRGGPSNYRAGLDRPKSSLGLAYDTGGNQARTGSIEVSDYSYSPLGISARRNYFDMRDPKLHGDSIDLLHVHEDYSLGYGGTRNFREDKQTDVYRVNGSAWGLALNSQYGFEKGEHRSQLHSLHLPSPLNLRLSYQESKSGEISRLVERHNFASLGALNSHLTLAFKRNTFPNAEADFSQTDAKEDVQYNGISWVKPGGELGGYCKHGDQCWLNLLNLKGEFRNQVNQLQSAYFLIPHAYRAAAKRKFRGDQEIGIIFNQQLAAAHWTEATWIQNQSAKGPFDSEGQLHLEYRRGEITLSADHDVPLYTEMPDERIFGRIAVQYDSTQVYSRLMVSSPYADMKKHWFLGAEVKYFFTPNIHTATLFVPTHTVQGEVKSNFAERPVARAKVALFSASTKIGETRTDDQGRFKLMDIPTSGEFRLVASKKKFRGEATFEKDLKDANATVDIELVDHVAIDVNFFIDTNEDGKLSEEDQPLRIANYIREINEAVINFPDAGYESNKIWVLKKGIIELIWTPELLPFEYEFFAIVNKTIDTSKPGPHKVEVLLRKRK